MQSLNPEIKTASITFHSAHNYGAMLQAYAFQQYLLSLGIKNEIIDFRTQSGKEVYPYPSFEEYSFFRKILHYKDVQERRSKYKKFESFLTNDLVLTQRQFNSPDDILALDGKYDFFISAGDQIFNIGLHDWTPAFLFPGIESRKFSYAVSMGHTPESIIGDSEKVEFFGDQLRNYDYISVREERSAKVISELWGLSPTVNIDPVFLLSPTEWETKIKLHSRAKPHDKYLLVYCPYYEPYTNQLASDLGFNLKLKVVTTTLCPLRDRFKYENLRIMQNAGPWEFLSLIKNSEFVLCRSYHAVVFSLIFHKPFYFFDTKNDSRIAYLLNLVGMSDRIITKDNFMSTNVSFASDMSFEYSDQVIKNEQKKSHVFIKQALNINVNF